VDLRKIARELVVGRDSNRSFGAVHKATESKPLTINLEKINILDLASHITFEKSALPQLRQAVEVDG